MSEPAAKRQKTTEESTPAMPAAPRLRPIKVPTPILLYFKSVSLFESSSPTLKTADSSPAGKESDSLSFYKIQPTDNLDENRTRNLDTTPVLDADDLSRQIALLSIITVA